MSANSAHILWVEDNELDVRAIIRASNLLQTPVRVEVVATGEAALDRLSTGGPQPDLVVLDIELPAKSGHAVLSEIRNDLALRHVPVVVLTTSDDDGEVRAAYDGGASGVLKKPSALSGWVPIVQHLDRAWLSAKRSPTS